LCHSGGTWQGCKQFFGTENKPAMTKQTFYNHAWLVIDCIIDEFADEMLCFREIDEPDELHSIARGFNSLTNNILPGCVGAAFAMNVNSS
jgi:hypothetical protein